MTTKDELKNRIEELEAENEQLRKENRPSATRRRLIRGAAIAGAGTVSLAAATGSAAAAPSGTYPVPSDNPLLKIRTDRMRLVERSTKPSSVGAEKALLYVLAGDLP